MKYLLISLLTLFVAIAIGSIVVKDPGYMLLSISGWKVASCWDNSEVGVPQNRVAYKKELPSLAQPEI